MDKITTSQNNCPNCLSSFVYDIGYDVWECHDCQNTWTQNSNKKIDFMEQKKILSIVPFPSLIKELDCFAKKEHAKIVFKKCVKSGKLKLANKITLYYGLQNKQDDTVISMKIALMAMRNI